LDNSTQKDTTEVIRGIENTAKTIQQFQSNAKQRICSCLSSAGPSVTVDLHDYKKGLVDATRRGVKLAFITEITKANMHHCKELMKLAQVRHLDGLRANFAVTESEYIATWVLEESAVVPHVFYSNISEMVEQQQSVFDTLWNKAIPAPTRIRELEEGLTAEKTEMIYGEEQILNTIVAWQYGSKKTWNLCLNAAIPAFSMSERIRKGYSDAKARGIEIRYITEITKDNLEYCKKIMHFAKMRHLEGLVGNFVVSEKEYLGEASGNDFFSHLIYSNRNEIVEQQNYIFENLWNNGIAAENKIRLIEEGTTIVETKIVEGSDAIVAKIRNEILDSNEIIAFSQPGLLQLIYDNFFETYKEILDRQNAGNHKGIRLIVTIDRNTVELVKHFVHVGVQVRHVKNLLPLSFVVTDKEVQANLEDIHGRKMIHSLLTSNEPVYVRQFASAFEQLWNDGIDAELRINDIIDGNDNEIEVIQNPSKAIELYAETISNAEKEIVLIFPTIAALKRQKKLGALERISTVSRERNVKVRILMPSHSSPDLTSDNLIQEDERRNIEIRYIETMSAGATILVVDKRISLVMELKDDSKDTFFEAIGLSTYSSSKGGVLSYVAMFENLWMQTDLLTQLKAVNEQLKVNDRMQKEFINVAAHELRTPIQPILSLSEVLRSDVTTAEGHELLDIIIRNAQRLQRLAGDVLDVTRIEGHSFELNIETFDLHQLLTYIIAGYREQVKKHNGQLKLTYNSNGNNKIPIQADKVRITQVVSNLTDNAMRFTKTGEISVSTETENHEVTVSVKDTGIGIHASIMPRLFSKFATKSMTGTGLGLFISKSIIEAHGGVIMGENNVDGEGATFRFTLPIGKCRGVLK